MHLLVTGGDEEMEQIGQELAELRPSGRGASAGDHPPGPGAGEEGAFFEIWVCR